MSDELQRIQKDPEANRLLQQERLIFEVTELICESMEIKGIKRSELAKALGRSRGRITQLLDGSENLTLRSIADVFTAMGKMVCVTACDIAIVEKGWSELKMPAMNYSVGKKAAPWQSNESIAFILDPDKIAA